MTTPARPPRDAEIEYWITGLDVANDKLFFVLTHAEADPLLRELLALRAENARLEGALQEIRRDQGVVCWNFELCDHVGCASSYASWAIADAALGGTTGKTTSDQDADESQPPR